MIAAWKRPDIAFEVRQEFYGDGVRCLRDEKALSHFQFIALERPRLRDQLISSATGEHQEIGVVPLSFNTIARFPSSSVYADHMGALHGASGGLRAIQKHAVQHSA